MPHNLKQVEAQLTNEINSVAIIMSAVVEKLEERLKNLEIENSIITNHYTNLYTRVKYLEDKFLKS